MIFPSMPALTDGLTGETLPYYHRHMECQTENLTAGNIREYHIVMEHIKVIPQEIIGLPATDSFLPYMKTKAE